MKGAKRILAFFFSIILLASSLLSPSITAASGTYELTFDNIFVFEQWANHAKSGVVSPGLSGGSMFRIGIWYAQDMLQIANYYD